MTLCMSVNSSRSAGRFGLCKGHFPPVKGQIPATWWMRPVTSAPSDTLITLIGASGFLGRHIVRALAKRGYRIRVACRRPDLAGHVQPLGVPGQIMPVQANVRYPDSLDAVTDGAHAVVNLTGILYSAGAQSFDAIHVFGAEASARAAKAARAKLFIQM